MGGPGWRLDGRHSEVLRPGESLGKGDHQVSRVAGKWGMVRALSSAPAARSSRVTEICSMALAAQKSLMTLTGVVPTGWCRKSLEGRACEELQEVGA